MLFFIDYLPRLHNTYALLNSWQTLKFVMSLKGMDVIVYLTEVFCPQSHTDSPFVGASDICQESALFSTPMY